MTLDPCSEANLDKSALSSREKNISDFRCVNGLPLSIIDLKQVSVSFSSCSGTN